MNPSHCLFMARFCCSSIAPATAFLIPTLQTIRTPTTGCEIEPVVLEPPLPCDSTLGVASRNSWRRFPRTGRYVSTLQSLPHVQICNFLSGDFVKLDSIHIPAAQLISHPRTCLLLEKAQRAPFFLDHSSSLSSTPPHFLIFIKQCVAERTFRL